MWLGGCAFSHPLVGAALTADSVPLFHTHDVRMAGASVCGVRVGALHGGGNSHQGVVLRGAAHAERLHATQQ